MRLLVHPKVCPVCGITHHNASNTLMCYKHYNQMKKYGKIMCANSRTVKDPNEIRIFDDYIEVDTYDMFGNVVATYICDKDKLSYIQQHKWKTTVAKNRYDKEDKRYMVTTIQPGKIFIYYHKEMLGNPDGIVMHKNGNDLDNRVSNLKIVEKTELLYNSRKREEQNIKTSYTKFKGCYYNKNRENGSPWHAEIKVGDERYVSPACKTIEECIYSRRKMEEFFGIKCKQDITLLENAKIQLTYEEKKNIVETLKTKFFGLSPIKNKTIVVD